jgi:hypothetical protein
MASSMTSRGVLPVAATALSIAKVRRFLDPGLRPALGGLLPPFVNGMLNPCYFYIPVFQSRLAESNCSLCKLPARSSGDTEFVVFPGHDRIRLTFPPASYALFLRVSLLRGYGPAKTLSFLAVAIVVIVCPRIYHRVARSYDRWQRGLFSYRCLCVEELLGRRHNLNSLRRFWRTVPFDGFGIAGKKPDLYGILLC